MIEGPIHRSDGDGWVYCSCGHKHWGKFGSAGLLLVNDGHVLLQHRALWSHFGGTWGMPGGARASGESAIDGALRETAEEAAVPPDAVRPSQLWVDDHGDWSYTTVVGWPIRDVAPRADDRESLEVRWVPVDDVESLPLLPAFGDLWPDLRKELGRRLVLVVDTANVMGSRPDGWWRDRLGAAKRLRDQLGQMTTVPAAEFGLPATAWMPDIVMIVEGHAKSLEPASDVRVASAPRNGDDTIVETVARAHRRCRDDHIVVVTADRELRQRVSAAGASVVGPSTLFPMITST